MLTRERWNTEMIAQTEINRSFTQETWSVDHNLIKIHKILTTPSSVSEACTYTGSGTPERPLRKIARLPREKNKIVQTKKRRIYTQLINQPDNNKNFTSILS